MMSLGLYTETRLWFQNLSITFWSENVKTLRLVTFSYIEVWEYLISLKEILTWISDSFMRSEFAWPAISIWKAQSRKKSPHTIAQLVNLSKHVPAMFDSHTILLFSLQNKQSNFSHVLTVIVCFVLFSNQGGKKNHTVGHERRAISHEVCREALNESVLTRESECSVGVIGVFLFFILVSDRVTFLYLTLSCTVNILYQ